MEMLGLFLVDFPYLIRFYIATMIKKSVARINRLVSEKIRTTSVTKGCVGVVKDRLYQRWWGAQEA